MNDRLRTMRRVLAVQNQIKRLAEWELATIEQKQREADGAARDLDAFIDGADLFGGLATGALRHRHRIAASQAALDRDHATQVEATLEARSRSKLAERLVDDLSRDDRMARERVELEQTIEALGSGRPDPDASLP